MDTPYQWTKQVASHWGGTRNGTIVHWPRGINAKGELRTQFHHDRHSSHCTGNGWTPRTNLCTWHSAKPYEGVSMAYSFNDAGAAEKTRDSVL